MKTGIAILALAGVVSLSLTPAAQAQKRELDCKVSTKIIYVREATRDRAGYVFGSDVEMYVSNCESDNLCIVHWPVYGQEEPAFVDSRDLADCDSARFKGRTFTNRGITAHSYKSYTRPAARSDR